MVALEPLRGFAHRCALAYQPYAERYLIGGELGWSAETDFPCLAAIRALVDKLALELGDSSEHGQHRAARRRVVSAQGSASERRPVPTSFSFSAILAQINGRRYAPFAGAVDGSTSSLGGFYRIERVTRRSTYVTPAGSLINRRVADQGFETLDLTESNTTSL